MRNDAGWGHTRKGRQAELEGIVKYVRGVLGQEGTGDRMIGVVFVAVEVKDGKPVAHSAATAYGELGIRMLVEQVDEVLVRVAGAVQAGQEARRESRVRGRKGRMDA